jgi:hypothetical protein
VIWTADPTVRTAAALVTGGQVALQTHVYVPASPAATLEIEYVDPVAPEIGKPLRRH